MQSVKRTLTMLLAALLLSACSGGNTNDTTADSASDANVDATDTAPVETEVTVELPDKNYGDAEVMFLTVQNTGMDQYSSHEIFADEMNGQLINDAVYVRNGQVEQALGVKIAESKQPDAEKVARSNLTAGDTTFDVVMPYMNRAIDLATEGFLMDLSTVPYLALGKPWWDGRVTKDMVIADKVFFSTGDISILDNECTMVMFFNKDLVTDYSLESPYTLVREKKWTIDKVGEMAAAVTNDVNGDGKMTNDDAWGLTSAFNAPISFYFASGERIVDKGADGNLQFCLGTDRSVDVLTKVFSLCLGDDALYNAGYGDAVTIFNEGRALFVTFALTDISGLRIRLWHPAIPAVRRDAERVQQLDQHGARSNRERAVQQHGSRNDRRDPRSDGVLFRGHADGGVLRQRAEIPLRPRRGIGRDARHPVRDACLRPRLYLQLGRRG